jgi:hypothetical protein
MIVEETFYRPDELAREARRLPAATYNRAHALLARAGRCVFVPIRSIQVLAVLDAEEFIFVEREGGRRIAIAWQRFRPGARTALDEPVAYEAVYYSPAAAQSMRRLLAEFPKALALLESRAPKRQAARVVPFPAKTC